MTRIYNQYRHPDWKDTNSSLAKQMVNKMTKELTKNLFSYKDHPELIIWIEQQAETVYEMYWQGASLDPIGYVHLIAPDNLRMLFINFYKGRYENLFLTNPYYITKKYEEVELCRPRKNNK